MKKFTILFTALALVSSVAVLAGPPKTKKPTAKPGVKKVALLDVWTCPVNGDKVTDKSAKGTAVGKYNVHFCCGACPPTFAKMDAKAKLAAAEKAAAKDKAPVKKG